jgi:hypothetical protein
VNDTLPVKIIPKSVLAIQGDPTLWGLRDTGPTSPSWGTEPVLLPTVAPLAGTLVLSPGRVGSLAINPPMPGDGWMPALKLAFPFLYIPAAQGVHATHPPIYELAAGTNPDELAEQIAAAMRTNDTLTVQYVSVGQPGFAVLNGAELTFAVTGTAG